MAYTKAQLEAIKNTLLANGSNITASESRDVEQAIIDEMYDPQSRADLFASLSNYVTPLATDKIFLFRSGVAGLLETSLLDFVQNFSDLSDVDTSLAVDDAIVYYNASTLKYESKTLDQFAISYNATAVRDALAGLIGANRLDASAIKNLPSDTAVQTVNAIAPSGGDVTLDADDIAETTARKWVSTSEKSTWNNKYDTPNAVRDALATLTGTNRLDANAIKNLPAGVSGEFLGKSITLVAHGFITGNVLTVDGSGNIVKVTSPSTQKRIGVVRTVINADNFELIISGFINNLSGLTAGQVYYSTITGTLSTTFSGIEVLVATSSTTGYMTNSGVATGGGTAGGTTFTPAGSIVATNVQTAIQELDTEKQAVSEKGSANGYASLNGSTLVPDTQISENIKTVSKHANFAALPGTGNVNKLYITTDNNFEYHWTGSVYALITSTNANNSITNVMLTDMPTRTVKARASAATGDPEDITEEQLRELIYNPNRIARIFSHFIGGSSEWLSFVNGTGASVVYTSSGVMGDGAGTVTLSTGTTATGYSFLRSGSTGSFKAQFGKLYTDILLSTPSSLSDGTDEYIITVAFTSDLTTHPAGNAFTLVYNHNLNGGKWQSSARTNSGAEQVVDSGITVVASTIYRLTISSNAAGTIWTFFINGTQVGQITVTAPSNNFGVGFGIRKILGTTSRTLLADWAEAKFESTLNIK